MIAYFNARRTYELAKRTEETGVEPDEACPVHWRGIRCARILSDALREGE